MYFKVTVYLFKAYIKHICTRSKKCSLSLMAGCFHCNT